MANHGVGMGKFCAFSGLLTALLIAPVTIIAAESVGQSITIEEALAQALTENPELAVAQWNTGIAAGVPKTHYTGNLQMLVTEAGHDQIFADYIVANAGMIDCDYYDGRVDSYTRAYSLENCAIRFEMAEFDSDSRSQVMTVSCPIDFNYFGNFADIGTNGTVMPGHLQIAGVEGLVNRVQKVINTAQAATNIGRNIGSVARQIGSLFG